MFTNDLAIQYYTLPLLSSYLPRTHPWVEKTAMETSIPTTGANTRVQKIRIRGPLQKRSQDAISARADAQAFVHARPCRSASI